MLKNIREIGIFMIAAQAVIHFAPGKQYEKYIKSVSGIVILLLFLKPFLQLSGAQWKSPEAVLEKLEEMTDMQDFSNFSGEESIAGEEFSDRMESGAGTAAVSRAEAEVKELLNRELQGETYSVKRVSIRLAENPAKENELSVSQMEIGLVKAAETEEGQIGIAPIVIGDAVDSEEETVLFQYRSRFAELLGIEEERVEVRLDGRD